VNFDVSSGQGAIKIILRMYESSKSKRQWGPLEWSVLRGSGIDIGPGPDPILPDVRTFDMEDGDANVITQYVHDTFDFVYSSHCLEHMHDPRAALQEWWKLVRPGGHLFFVVPDEDLYEQGVFPSRFNPGHKATFTLSKTASWSPVSLSVLDLAHSLPGGKLVRIALQDAGYDRDMGHFGPPRTPLQRLLENYRSRNIRTGFRIRGFGRLIRWFLCIDQTAAPLDALAQIQCIVRKTGHGENA